MNSQQQLQQSSLNQNVKLVPKPATMQRQPFGTSAQNNQQKAAISASVGKDGKTPHQQLRSQLNQTNGNFHSKIQQPPAQNRPLTQGIVGAKPGSIQKAMIPNRLGTGTIVHHQLETELSVIYSIYKKTQEMLQVAQAGGNQAKLMTTVDVDKWRKKFYLVFTRERGTLDLSINPQQILDLKNITLNPQATTRVGERILKSNVKFWILYLNLIESKLNDFLKATLRARLFGNLESGAIGSFSRGSENYDLLLKEIGTLIQAEKLLQETQQEDILPTFGAVQSEGNQNADQISITIPPATLPVQNNETFTGVNQEGGLLIESPEEGYLVTAPQMSAPRFRNTPQFIEQTPNEENHSDDIIASYHQENEPEAQQDNQEEDGEDGLGHEVQIPDTTFYTCREQIQPNITFYQEAVDNEDKIEETSKSLEEEKIEEQLDHNNLQLLNKEEDNQVEQVSEDNYDPQIDVQQSDQSDKKEEVIEPIINVQLPNEESVEIQNKDSQEIIDKKHQIISEKIDPPLEQQEEEKQQNAPIVTSISSLAEDLTNLMSTQAVNPKKRKRSPSPGGEVSNPTNGGMTLRSRIKKRKLNEDATIDPTVNDGTYDLANPIGASFLRYEVIEKKGKQIVVPVRYSIRRQKPQQLGLIEADSQDMLERQILNGEIEFEYKPNEDIESKFTMDQQAMDIQKLLKKNKVKIEEIQDIVAMNDGYALLKIIKDKRELYGNNSYVAVNIKGGRLSKDLMSDILAKTKHKRGGVMFTQVQDRSVLEYIKNTYQPPQMRVTRQNKQ